MKEYTRSAVKVNDKTNDRLKALKIRLGVKSSDEVICVLLDLDATTGATEKLEALRVTQDLIASNLALLTEMVGHEPKYNKASDYTTLLR